MIKFRCACGTMLSVPDSAAGKQAKCPKCQKILPVPAEAAPAPEPIPPRPVAAPAQQPAAQPPPAPEPAVEQAPPPVASGESWGVRSADEPPIPVKPPRERPRARPARRPKRRQAPRTSAKPKRRAKPAEDGRYIEPNPLSAWAQAMFSPASFFTDQRQAEGVTGPLIFTAMMYALPFLGILFTFKWFGVPLGIALAVAAVWAAVIVPINNFHNSLWLFIITRVTTKKGTYTGAIRILTYSMAPYALMVIPFEPFALFRSRCRVRKCEQARKVFTPAGGR